MTRICPDCSATYDDARQWTICPHEPLKSPAQEAAWDLGHELLGKEVAFLHQPDGPYYRVQGLRFDGMVTLAGMAGEFAPQLFRRKT